MKIREELDIIIEKHPHAESLNKKLIEEHKRSENNVGNYYTNVIGKKTFASDRSSSSPVRLVEKWAEDILRGIYTNPTIKNEKVTYETSSWFALYNEGDYAKIHNHIPFSLFSFVYFINSPKGSSPLVFTTSGKKIKAEAGKIVLFPSNVMHHVPKNKCKERIVFAGNIKIISLD